MTPPGQIALARAYSAAALPGVRCGAGLLVDRVWPRGMSKAELQPDAWLRDIAPSTELRKWFGHRVDRWDEFRTRYRSELDANPDAVACCLDWCRKGPVTLIYGAQDQEHNQAVVLAEYLQGQMSKKAP